MLDDITLARINRNGDNTEIKPIDLLRYLIDEMENNGFRPSKLLVITVSTDRVTITEPDVDSYDIFRAGVDYKEELMMIEYAKEKFLRRAFGDGR